MKFTPIIQSVLELEPGCYAAYLDNGEPCMLEVVNVSNGRVAFIDRHFHYDIEEKVIAVAPFPPLDLSH